MKGYIALLSLIALGAAIPVDLVQKRSVAADGSNQESGLVATANTIGAEGNAALDNTGNLDPNGGLNYGEKTIEDLLGLSDANPSGSKSDVTKRYDESEVDELVNHISNILASAQKRSTENTATTLGGQSEDTVRTANDGVNQVAGDANDALDAAQSGNAAGVAGSILKGFVDFGSGVVETTAAAGDGLGDTGAAALNAKRSVAADGSNQVSGLAATINTIGAEGNTALDNTGNLDPNGGLDYLGKTLSALLSLSDANPSGSKSDVTKRYDETEVDKLLNHISDLLASFQKRSTENTATTLGGQSEDTVRTANDGVNQVAGDANDALDAAQSGDPVTVLGSILKGIVDFGSGVVETTAAAGDGIGKTGAAALNARDTNEASKALI